MKISGRSKAMAWVAGAAVAAGVALATYPDAAPAVPPQVPSAEVLQSAVKVAGLIESSSVVDDVPNVSGYQRGCGKGEFCFSEQEFKLGNHVEVLPEIDPNPGIPRSVVADPRFIVASTCAILSLTPV